MSTYQNVKDFFINDLNPKQQQVVAPPEGVLLVCAGAGSGKTRVITARMAYLIMEHGVGPDQIIALTFTNKASREMKERITRFLGTASSLPYVGTFHSYCLRTLKSNAHLLPFSTFSLMDDRDQDKLVRTIIQEKGLSKKVTPRQILSFISRIKNEATNDAEREAAWGHDLLMRDIYHLYEKLKTSAHCLDFDDLLLHTLTLFRKNDLFKQAFQQHVRHILIDEYQDTNKVQHALLKAMTQQENDFALDSLCVVGDEDQSIYSWRGATVSNIINFSRDFPAATSITIEQNYRSVQPILETANEIIKNNTLRNPKKLFSERKAADRIRLLTCASGYQEGEAVAQLLLEARMHDSLSSHAVLYRSHFQSRSLEEALIRHAIPYKIMGGIQFYDRLEIKDMLSYMRLIINPYDRLAFSRAINTPSRGLGDKFEELFYTTWDLMPFEDFKSIARTLIEHKQLTQTKEEALTTFLAIFEGLTTETKPSTVLTTLIDRTHYYTHLKNFYEKEEAEAKKDNVKEFINGVLFFEERNEAKLDGFLQEVSLLQEHMHDKEDASDYVRLMTFHAAKGLEFDTIILAGLEDGILPSAHSLFNPESLEEERRLLYVGITRARERLLLMHTKYRYTYGQLSNQQPSRFLDELPQEQVSQDDVSLFKERDFRRYFRTWLDGTSNGKDTYRRKNTSSTKSTPSDLEYGPAFLDDINLPWQQYQSVMHKKFGRGVIEKIEQKSNTTYLTIRFKGGIKKLDASFVSAL